ncbi:DUF421 domain-containing protein [Pontibacter harenae]|uniref:DUF421 domain-containing protein n=1 Tax=Pontibacter harenae TaxID=2894083 RepID=UPI001E2C2184|nr:YetF domain-containing protein [Pontibacter harenae]MCC9167260.1 DUF421 domain-containing protein [Pontibacter harenae]
MKPEDIHITDWLRILLGEVPWSFLFEVVIRIIFIFFILIFSMRLMGKRMAAQLTRMEMAALVSMAAAIGVPMADPTRGLVPIVIIAAVVIGVQRVVSTKSAKDTSFESTVLDDMDIVVKDGVLHLETMERTKLTRERLFAELRSEEIGNLGKAQRVYLEANGSFTVYKFNNPKPGLSIIPRWDTEFFQEQSIAEDAFACCSCGDVVLSENRPKLPCTRCGSSDWAQAVCA